MKTTKPLQFMMKILYPVCEKAVINMARKTINDNQSLSTGADDENSAIGKGLYLGPPDIGILVFSTLIINMFSLAVPLVTLQVEAMTASCLSRALARCRF